MPPTDARPNPPKYKPVAPTLRHPEEQAARRPCGCDACLARQRTLRDLYAAGSAKTLPLASRRLDAAAGASPGVAAVHDANREVAPGTRYLGLESDSSHFAVCRRDARGRCRAGTGGGGSGVTTHAGQAGDHRPAAAAGTPGPGKLRAALEAVVARVKATVPEPVRRAAVAFASHKMREYARVFGPKNARVLVSAAGLLGLVPVPGALPLGFALVEGCYWACRGARVVSGSGSKALEADTHERLGLAAIAVLRDWYARNGRQAPAVPVEVARRAVAAVGDDDPDTGWADDAAGVKALRGESWFRRCPRDEHGRYLPRRVGASGTAGQPAAAAPTPVPPPRRPTPPLPAPPKATAKRIKPPTVPTGWLRSPRRAAAVKALLPGDGHAKELDVPGGDEVAEALKQPNPVRHPGGRPRGAGAGGCDCGPGCVCGECRVTYGGGEGVGADCGAAGEHQEECAALWAEIQEVDLMLVGLSTALAGARGRSPGGVRDPDGLRARIADLQRRRRWLCRRLAERGIRCPACAAGSQGRGR
jgi:hypothetical protein